MVVHSRPAQRENGVDRSTGEEPDKALFLYHRHDVTALHVSEDVQQFVVG